MTSTWVPETPPELTPAGSGAVADSTLFMTWLLSATAMTTNTAADLITYIKSKLNFGLQSTGQVTITSSTTLGSTQAGANTLVNGSGITLTFPSTAQTFALSNVGAYAVTLSFPGTSDYPPVLTPGAKVMLAGDGSGNWRVVLQSQLAVPTNEWPDPQLCVQDIAHPVSAMNDACSGALAAISVSSYTTGSQTVVCSTTNTTGLLVGTMGYFSNAADVAMQFNYPSSGIQAILRVTAVVANTSFTVVLDFTQGVPSASHACTFQPVMRGDLTGVGGGDITSQISKGVASTLVWISDRPAHTNQLVGCARVLIVQKSTAGAETIFLQGSPEGLASLYNQNRAVGMGVVVVSGSGAAAQCFINNGAYQVGGVIATASTRTWISQQVNFGAPGIYQAGVQLTGPAGSTFILGEFTEGVSSAVYPDGSYSTPRNQYIRFKAGISPWVIASITFANGNNNFVDVQQFSQGQFVEGVEALEGQFQGQCTTFPDFIGTSSASPGRTTTIAYCPVLRQFTNASGHAGDGRYYAQDAQGLFHLSPGQPYFSYYGSGSGPVWQYLSWNFASAILNVTNN